MTCCYMLCVKLKRRQETCQLYAHRFASQFLVDLQTGSFSEAYIRNDTKLCTFMDIQEVTNAMAGTMPVICIHFKHPMLRTRDG